MCFSAQASFIMGGLLFPASLYAITKAIRSDKSYLLFALIPMLFSVQQFIEGIVWVAVNNQMTPMLYYSSLLYIFVAFLIWPTYFPLSLYFVEPYPLRKQCFLALSILGLTLGLITYIPLLLKSTFFETKLGPVDICPHRRRAAA